MAARATLEVQLQVTDVSRQKKYTIPYIPKDSTVRELVQDVVPLMRLPRNDTKGRPLVYQTLHERAGRHLHSSEKLADVVEIGDRLVLTPSIEAAGTDIG